LIVACGSPTRHSGDDTPEVDALSNCNMEGAQRCEGARFHTCTGGTWQTAVDCPQQCLDGLGCVQCTPGQSFCKDGNVWSCDDAGNPLGEVSACTGVNTCVGGSCVDACLDAAASKSYIGCEYWAVDLDNAVEVWGAIDQPLGNGVTLNTAVCTNAPPAGYGATVATLNVCYGIQGGGPNAKVYAFGLCDPPATMGGAARCPAGLTCGSQQVCISDAQHSPFAVVVSNPQAKDVTVTVTGPGAQVITQTIAAGQVSAIKPQTASSPIPDQSVDGSTKEKRAYKITSDLPIVAYQFNPLDNVNVFSNDASLLIPRTAFDQDYYAMSMPTLDRRAGSTYGSNPYYCYMTVVAWQDGSQIQFTPTVATTASAINATLAAGTPTTFTLNAFDVLQLEASGAGDLTGTHITSPNMMSYGVFGGHEATVFGETTPPDTTHTSRCCADHLEEMMFPSSTWGKEFAIARSQSRMTNENDTIRVLAQAPGTTVTFTPPPTSGTCATLAAGQFCEVRIMVDTEISANEPILVGHFLQAATWSTPPGTPASQRSTIGTGDPSMAIAAPTEQFRKDYAFLVPAQYSANYVSISAAATGGVTLDGVPVTLAAFTGGGTHRAARVQVAAGQHKITCADGCGITVYGYSDGVSYMFAGGLDLKPIVIF
jgi:hypothetical protein